MNKKNLKRGNPETQFKSGREAVENGRKGGIRSGESKRKTKKIKENLKAIMAMPIPDNLRSMLIKNGMQIDEDSDCSEALSYMIFFNSLKGNPKILRMLLEQIGEDTASNRADKELNFKIKEAKKKDSVSDADGDINIIVSAAEPISETEDEDENEN